MIVAKLVEISAEMMKILSKYDIRIQDYTFLPLFAEYERMTQNGHKISYIVALLAEEYKISEASVYRILRRFRKSVKI